ncbi:MAG TPA: hypothetical protein VE987_02115 [Polyangiaceae bacterium]|nr:hypothetical protein [Polyangiaceae bacterium]
MTAACGGGGGGGGGAGSDAAGSGGEAASTDGPTDAGADAPSDVASEPACDDDAGMALVCHDAGAAACGLADDQCPAFVAHLKPRVANTMYTCVANSTCMSGDFAACIIQTFAAACPDDSAMAPCATIVAACADAGTPALDTCVAQLAPMTGSGRDAVVSCITGDGGICDLALCVQGAL